MSRLRFPFRSQQSTNQVPSVVPLTQKELANADYWSQVEAADLDGKGKAKEAERLWGLENFGNTCYCNSVLQALYACQPFRQFVESYPDIPPPIWPLAPPPGTASQAIPFPSAAGGSTAYPGSPLAIKTGNPFDNPALTNGSLLSPTSPTVEMGKKGKGWPSLGRRPTASNSTPGGPPTLASIQQQQQQQQQPPPPTPAAAMEAPLIPLNPDQPPPTVFETIQTLFQHLSVAAPHQPLAPKKLVNANADNAQTASLLPAGAPAPGGAPASPSTASGPPGQSGQPQGPPLLASLPPPSAPRGGGPFSAGSLGRGVVRPEDLLKTVKNANEMFRGMAQQDAHEFLGWVLNKVAEEVEVVDRSLRSAGKSVTEPTKNGKTFVQNLFEGVLTNETRCLSCEMTSSRDELFLDLSIDIEQHSSVTACLRQFSASEMLCQKNKFYCDSCCGLHEAEKRMKIKRLPNVLALHLKRFKYSESVGRYTKLFYRVPFPTQLRLPNTADDTEDPDRLYELFAVVVHIGNGPHHGHYVCMVRSAGRWVMCDDENVEPIEENDIYRYFGDYASGAGYVLFYQSIDLSLKTMGLINPPSAPVLAPTVKRPAVVTSAPENLMDITEDIEAPVPSPSVKTPLRVDIPSQPEAPVVPKALLPPSPVTTTERSSLSTATSRDSTPAGRGEAARPVERNGHLTAAPPPPLVSSPARQSSIGATPVRQPSLNSSGPRQALPSPSLGKEKEKESKWYQRKKSSIDPSTEKRASLLTSSAPTAPSPGRAPPSQPSGPPQAVSSVPSAASGGTTNFAGLGVNVPSSLLGPGADGVRGLPTPSGSSPGRSPNASTNLSSSVMSNRTGLSSSTSGSVFGTSVSPTTNVSPRTQMPATMAPSSPPNNQQATLGLGRNPSMTSSTRNRTVSQSSRQSSVFGGPSSGEKTPSLSRRLSGMGGKLTRSSSLFKLGKKEKNGANMEGVEEELAGAKGKA